MMVGDMQFFEQKIIGLGKPIISLKKTHAEKSAAG
jgi:hypothetical protein